MLDFRFEHGWCIKATMQQSCIRHELLKSQIPNTVKTSESLKRTGN